MKKKDGDGITTSDDLDLLVQKLRWLRLPGMAKLVAAILERAAKENLSSTDVVHRLCDEEKQSRIKSAVERRLRDARFPEINTVDAFNFDFDPARKKLRARYLAMCCRARCLKRSPPVSVILGASGVRERRPRNAGAARLRDQKGSSSSCSRLSWMTAAA
jgi:DNA replication protein DnaC